MSDHFVFFLNKLFNNQNFKHIKLYEFYCNQNPRNNWKSLTQIINDYRSSKSIKQGTCYYEINKNEMILHDHYSSEIYLVDYCIDVLCESNNNYNNVGQLLTKQSKKCIICIDKSKKWNLNIYFKLNKFNGSTTLFLKRSGIKICMKIEWIINFLSGIIFLALDFKFWLSNLKKNLLINLFKILISTKIWFMA